MKIKKNMGWLNLLLLLVTTLGFSQTIKGTYAIENVDTGMVLRIKDASRADGTPLVAYSPVNWKCVTWDFQHVSGQTYQLKNLFTHKTFEFVGNTAEGGKLQQLALVRGKPGQQYEFIPIKENIYLIKLKDMQLYLTPMGDKATINSEIVLFPKKEGTLQHWTIYEQHPTR